MVSRIYYYSPVENDLTSHISFGFLKASNAALSNVKEDNELAMYLGCPITERTKMRKGVFIKNWCHMISLRMQKNSRI